MNPSERTPSPFLSAFQRWSASNPSDLGGLTWARLVWGVGILVILAGFVWEGGRAALWTAAFGSSGTLCLANAVRARRFHCVITGPIFLAGAVVTVLRAAEVIKIDWFWIGGGVLVGVAASLALESIIGKKSFGGDC